MRSLSQFSVKRIRRPAVVVSVCAIILTLAGVPGASGSPGVASGVGAARSCPSVAADAITANRVAQACGSRVEILDARTEYAQVFADPGGSQTMSVALEPQRVQRTDGTWVGIDTTLKPAGGSVEPVATATDIDFSAGGTAPLVTWRENGHTFTLSWPSPLPTPVLADNSATYPEVLPGVDLVVQATSTGFGHILVIKNAAAASNPAVGTIRYAIGGDAEVTKTPEGGLVVSGGGTPFAWSGQADMWDTGTATAKSTATDSSDAASHGAVTTHVRGGDLVLTPDEAFLSKPDLAFPIMIDPAFSAPHNSWTYATSNDTDGPTTDTNISSGDPSPAAPEIRVGKDPASSRLYRSFLRFPLAWAGFDLHGTTILSAQITGRFDHTWYCAPGLTTNYFYRSGAIATSPRQTWPGPALHTYLGAVSANANEDSCNDSNQTFELGSPASSALKDDLQAVADASWTTGYTVAVTAAHNSGGAGETTTERWARYFRNDFRLQATFNTAPDAPTNLRTTSPTTGCVTGSTRPFVSDNTPLLTARLTDADTTNIQAEFEWFITYGGIVGNPPLTAAKQQNQDFTYQVPSSGAEAMLHGNNYSWRVRAYDGFTYGPWSAWCEMTIDTVAPVNPPQVSSATYPENAWGGGIGTAGTFIFTAGDSDVNSFLYGFNTDTPSTPVAATTLGGSSSPVSFSPTQFGPNWVTVRSVDRAGGLGPIRTYVFKVNGSDPSAWWKLDEGSGSFGNDSSGFLRTAALSNHAWGQGRHFGTDPTDLAVTFNGTSTVGATASAVIDTNRSFTVTAWVKLAAGGQNRMVLTQDGTTVSGMYLGYDGLFTGRWAFWMPDADTIGAPAAMARADTAPVEYNTWTHLAAVYDHEADTIALYVDGMLAATAPRPASWSAAGATQIGRGKYGVQTDYWSGTIDDVRVFPGPLDEGQIFTIYSEFRP